jgi:hypothetical protein
MLVNILQCTGQLPHKQLPGSKANIAEIRKYYLTHIFKPQLLAYNL